MQLPAPVDANIKQILGVKLEIEPRATIGNHPGAIQELAG